MTEALTSRPEIYREIGEVDHVNVVSRKLSTFEMLYREGWLRKTILLVLMAIAWEGYAIWVDNPLLFPRFTATLEALYVNLANGSLQSATIYSVHMLLLGYVVGVVLAAILTVLAINTRIGTDFLETVTAMLNPLPAVALLPLALLWFGLGTGSLVFVLVHSVLWPVSLNTYSGFQSVSTTMRMVGQNYGITGIRFVWKILVPAAFPSILSGLKIGWAFGWRTLIAAELVFGVSSGNGGLGWFIFSKKNELDIPAVFAGLLTIIIIGLVIENVIFRRLTTATVVKWGMQS